MTQFFACITFKLKSKNNFRLKSMIVFTLSNATFIITLNTRFSTFFRANRFTAFIFTAFLTTTTGHAACLPEILKFLFSKILDGLMLEAFKGNFP